MNVLESIRPHVNSLQYVNFDEDAIKNFSSEINKKNLHLSVISLTKYDWDLTNLLQLIFFFNSMVFCFWAEKDKPKWTIKVGGEELDGAVALFRTLEERLHEDTNFLNVGKISSMSLPDFKKMFKGNVEIPLLKERYDTFLKTSQILERKFNGKFTEILKQSGSNSSKMLALITENFSTFEDDSLYKGEKVYFQKRTQLQVKMVNDALLSKKLKCLKDLDVLTAFADYKVPQILRYFGMIKYHKDLAEKVDNFVLIEKDSIMENEIRIATVWAAELIRQEVAKKYPEVTASHIDSYLWNKAQSIKTDILPYHRTYTTAY